MEGGKTFSSENVGNNNFNFTFYCGDLL